MKFTIARLDLENLVKAASPARARKSDTITLTAFGSRVFVDNRGVVAAMDVAVMADGAVTLPAKAFRKVLDTYKGTRLLEFEASAEGLRIQTFRMSALSFDSKPKPPADFHVLPPLK